MSSLTADPARFQPYRESLLTTVARTGAIAIVVTTVICLVQFHHLPSTSGQLYFCFGLLVFVSWITFGGHWVEIAYLNGIRPRIAHWPDSSLTVLRLCVWIVGGALLFAAGLISRTLLLTGALPPKSQAFGALLVGGPAFIVVEMVAHIFLMGRGRPSFWNRRG